VEENKQKVIAIMRWAKLLPLLFAIACNGIRTIKKRFSFSPVFSEYKKVYDDL
jgi:hypothetical protein